MGRSGRNYRLLAVVVYTDIAILSDSLTGRLIIKRRFKYCQVLTVVAYLGVT